MTAEIKRCTATVTSDGLQQLVKVEVYGNDVSEDVEHHQPYGMAANVGTGTGLLVTVAGHQFVIGLDNAGDRVKGLSPGEVCLWSKFGQRVHLKADGSAEYTATEHVFNGDVIADGISLKHHLHIGDSGGITEEPIK